MPFRFLLGFIPFLCFGGDYYNNYLHNDYTLLHHEQFGVIVSYTLIPDVSVVDTCSMLFETSDSFLLVKTSSHKVKLMKSRIIYIEWKSMFEDNVNMEISGYE